MNKKMFIEKLDNFYAVAIDLASTLFFIGVFFSLVICTFATCLFDIGTSFGIFNGPFTTNNHLFCVALALILDVVFVCVKSYKKYRKTGEKFYSVFDTIGFLIFYF